jgi:hypothetical protein
MNNRKFVFFSNQVTGINMKIIPVSRKIVNELRNLRQSCTDLVNKPENKIQ